MPPDVVQVVMEYNFHWAGQQQMEMLMQPLPPTWGKYSPSTVAQWASSLFRCKVNLPLLGADTNLRQCSMHNEMVRPDATLSSYILDDVKQGDRPTEDLQCVMLTCCPVSGVAVFCAQQNEVVGCRMQLHQ